MPGLSFLPGRKFGTHPRACGRQGWTAALLVLVVLLGFVPVCAGADPDSVLRDYVRAPDPVYGFRLVRSVQRPGCTIHILNMTSQRWRTHADVNHALWSHWLAVIVPQAVHTDIAMLIVEGGMNMRSSPSLHNLVVEAGESIALATGTTVVVMGQVPNEPLYFTDTSEGLMEDELVAYSWDKAMDTGDFTWPAYVPMVKSVVRAMDTVQTYMRQAVHHPVNRFVLVGFSKRGAVTWLTAAVDSRVMAFAAGVFDVLDIAAQLEHQFEAYGKYTSVMHAYAAYGIIRRLRSPEGRELMRVVDPYSYLGAIRQPKLLINATGDPFFLPDAAQQYVSRLRGETLWRYFPNTGHTLRNRKTLIQAIVDTLINWYGSILTDQTRPRISWSFEHGGLRVRSEPAPQAARLWQASNPKRRDFRDDSIGDAWTSTPLAVNAQGEMAAPLATPKRGWRAWFVELDYPHVDGRPQAYTTPVFVQPNTLPYVVVDPVGTPRDAAYWKDQVLRAQQNDFSAEIGAARLAGYLPLPLFGAYVRDVAAAARIMTSTDDPADQARRQCFATRLNIAHHQLGWYSRLNLDATGERPLWQYYREADRAFRQGAPGRARDLCAAMNGAARAASLSRSPGTPEDRPEYPPP